MNRKRLKRITLGAIAILLVAGGGYWWWNGEPRTDVLTYNPSQECTTDPRTVMHIHPQLSILIDGEAQDIPANVGVLPTCLRPIHTHDATGTLHIESPVVRDFTLGEFFQVWGKTFDREHIFEHTVDAKHRLHMSVDGQPSDAFENLVLLCKEAPLTPSNGRLSCEGQRIVISFGASNS